LAMTVSTNRGGNVASIPAHWAERDRGQEA
jgi:hypothetical protein